MECTHKTLRKVSGTVYACDDCGMFIDIIASREVHPFHLFTQSLAAVQQFYDGRGFDGLADFYQQLAGDDFVEYLVTELGLDVDKEPQPAPEADEEGQAEADDAGMTSPAQAKKVLQALGFGDLEGVDDATVVSLAASIIAESADAEPEKPAENPVENPAENPVEKPAEDPGVTQEGVELFKRVLLAKKRQGTARK